jgi:hypothetical protein
MLVRSLEVPEDKEKTDIERYSSYLPAQTVLE